MTDIVCKATDCIHNNGYRCNCHVIGVQKKTVLGVKTDAPCCDSYFETPAQLKPLKEAEERKRQAEE